ncbi:hypothetical protein Q8W71_24335 [Methylobacterium sp. NEAU 140]|uniref:hypothetical protein n=1 Tax=Methylobacterium sp. NEAU 140 TaxID=3064945 RepID=UPI002736E07C|nr:hypothetical protein [Methylobacterium sp. NEAU 140]MDP4025764.1 hypothetical protein [Methylobacterium sp. NEAU 140]
MSYRDLPALVTQREEAVILLEAIASGVDERELAPFVAAMTTYEAEQAAAIMRGSGNEMALRVQLGALLAEAELVSNDEVFAALDARRALGPGEAA